MLSARIEAPPGEELSRDRYRFIGNSALVAAASGAVANVPVFLTIQVRFVRWLHRRPTFGRTPQWRCICHESSRSLCETPAGPIANLAARCRATRGHQPANDSQHTGPDYCTCLDRSTRWGPIRSAHSRWR